MKLVVDASVALKWILSPLAEANAIEADEILASLRRGTDTAIAPPHWRAEIIGVVARLEPARLPDALELLYTLNVEVADDRRLLESAARLASMLDHHLFDTLYHAVAIEHAAMLITADERYFAKARGLGNIQLLGHGTE